MNTKNLKPFNLQSALRGEPVMLRNGNKAFIRHHETELPINDHWRLWGVVISESGSECTITSWPTQGRFSGELEGSSLDIIGMYPKTRIINGFEVPAPETEEPKRDTCYHAASPTRRYFHSIESWDDSAVDKYWLKRGLVFLNAEDAIANAKAMVGINPYEEGEE